MARMTATGQGEVRPILVVDDDVKIVRLVRMYLERAGHRVVEATDGLSALAAIALETPRLVVLDVMLPEVDGLAILQAVRRTDRTPIIILSARGLTDDRITGLAAGADDYLPKPFSPAELGRIRLHGRCASCDEPSGRPGQGALADVATLRVWGNGRRKGGGGERDRNGRRDQ